MINSFNKSMQGNGVYPGVDNVESLKLKGIKLVVSAEALNQDGNYMKGNYYLEPEEVLKLGLNAVSICQKAQVAAFYNSQLYGGIPNYKTKLVAYTIDGVEYEIGKALANAQYGEGGSHQIVIQNKDSAKKIDLNNIGTIDLNKNDKELLKKIINDYKKYINRDGTIDLKNTAITKKVYDIMELKTQLHKYKIDYLCTLKEYENELKSNRNLNELKELDFEIKGIEKSISSTASTLDKAYVILDKKLDVQAMNKEEIEYFLNKENYCPRDILSFIEYEKIKIKYLEEQYNIDNKLDTADIKDLNAKKFKINDTFEKKINERYEMYSTGSVNNVGREQIHFRKVDKNIMNLLHSLTVKDSLNKVLVNLHDNDIKAICQNKMEAIDKEIKNTKKNIKDFDSIDNDYKTTILYLDKKVGDINRYSDTKDNNWFIEKDSNAFRQYYDNKNKFTHSKNVDTLIDINGKVNEFFNKVNEIKNCKTEMNKESSLIAGYSKDIFDLESIKENQKYIDYLNKPNITTLEKSLCIMLHKKEIDSYNKLSANFNVNPKNIDIKISDFKDKIKVNEVDFMRLYKLMKNLGNENIELKEKILSFKSWEYDDLENLGKKDIVHEKSDMNTKESNENDLAEKKTNKDDEFMKEYLEKQRRRSLAKEKQKNLDIER